MTSCLHSLTMQPFRNRFYSLRKKIASREKIIFFKFTPTEMGGNMKIKLLPLEVYPFTLIEPGVV